MITTVWLIKITEVHRWILRQTAAGGKLEYVRETTGLIGFRKFAGWWIYEDGWQLYEKAE